MPSISPFNLPGALLLLGGMSRVSAHGFVTDIVIAGQQSAFQPAVFHIWADTCRSFPGFNVTDAKFKPQPPSIAWTNEAFDSGYIFPDAYVSNSFICHLNATPASESATVAAGYSIDLQWSGWFHNHQGPIINYLAKWDGDCATANKTALKFFKIQGAGFLNSTTPALLATDEMIHNRTVMDDRKAVKLATEDMMGNNLTTSVTIPASIAPGNYVLPHELFDLRFGRDPNGAQHYSQCFNFKVTGSGSETPPGIPACEFYMMTDPGIVFDIWTPMNTYIIRGPPVYTGGASGNTGNSVWAPSMSGSAPSSSYSASNASHAAPSSAAAPYPTGHSSMMTTGTEAGRSSLAWSGSAWKESTADQTSTSAPDEMTSTTTMYPTITLTTTVHTGNASTTSNKLLLSGTGSGTPGGDSTAPLGYPAQSAVQTAAHAMDTAGPDFKLPNGMYWREFVSMAERNLPCPL
jgi:lytic cellulose monooxygenase (C1-hydroxylating)